MKTKIPQLGLHCCSAQARTGQLQALFAPLSGGTGLWPCPTRPASVARSGRNRSPTDEKYMRRSVLRTAAGQAAVGPSRCSGGGCRATAKGNSIALARIKFVQESWGSSNQSWLRLRGKWCLTPRSSRAPTAGRAGHQALGLRPILRLLSSTPHRRCRLNSNVRPQNSPHGGPHPSKTNFVCASP